ncbi:MAG TPA: hypothetical protein VK504_19275, partial [Vicinamibacterales bacterium]|nr:hypothetical protein [Vicinamibacterales bacterium]
RKTSVVAVVALIALAAPQPAVAWGTAAHRHIMARAIDLLPAELKPFFVQHKDEVVMRVVDPDLFRVLGWEEDPNHFVNFGAKELGEYPFKELPREYGAAIEKFGLATLRRNGLLPWRQQEEFGNLRRAFEGFTRETYGVGNTVVFAAVMSHYIQDAHQPLHASANYDGQMTGNTGIHARFETALFERFQSRLTIRPAPPAPIVNSRDAAFDALLSSYKQVDSILKADDEAKKGKETYDDEYYERLFTTVRPILEQRLGEAITATAGLIMGAWEQAGRPVLKPAGPRPPQKIKP